MSFEHSLETAARFRRMYTSRRRHRGRGRIEMHRPRLAYVRFWANALPVLAGNLATAGALAARGIWNALVLRTAL